MRNILFDPPVIRRQEPRSLLDFEKRHQLSFHPQEVLPGQDEILFYAPGKRTSFSLVRNELVDLSNPPRLVSRPAYFNGTLIAFEEDENLIIARGSGFSQVPNDSFRQAASSLHMDPKGLLLHDEEKRELWRYSLRHSDPFDRKHASWELLGKHVILFLSGDKVSLFLQSLPGEDIPSLSLVDEKGDIYHAPGFLETKALYASAGPGAVYSAKDGLLRLLDFKKGDSSTFELDHQPRKIRNYGDKLLLLGEHLDLRSEEGSVRLKERSKNIRDAHLTKERLFLLTDNNELSVYRLGKVF